MTDTTPTHPWRQAPKFVPSREREARRRYAEDWHERVRYVRLAGITNLEARDRLLAAEVAEEINQ